MKSMNYLALFVAAAMPLFAADTQDQTVPDNTSTATAQPAAAANLSPAATEVVRLASGGVGDDVVEQLKGFELLQAGQDLQPVVAHPGLAEVQVPQVRQRAELAQAGIEAERQHGQNHIVRGVVQVPADTTCSGQEVAVGQDDALRLSGAPRGVEDRGDIDVEPFRGACPVDAA